MKFKFGIVLIIVTVLSCSHNKTTTGTMQLESSLDVNNWMINYYKNPEPETIPTVIEIVNNESRLFSQTPPERSPLSGFLSIVFKKDYKKALKLAKETESYSRIVKHTIWYSMWLADTESFQKYLKSTLDEVKGQDLLYLQQLLGSKPLRLKIIKPTEGGQLDVLWGAFLPVVIKNILNELFLYYLNLTRELILFVSV